MVPLVAPVESNGPHRHLRVTPFLSAELMAAGDRQSWRRLLRARRAALGATQRLDAARLIASYIAATRWLHGARSIGLYASVGNEVPTGPLIVLARSRHCPIYLPRIVDYRQRRMVFALESKAPAPLNRHGIPEPSGHRIIDTRALSVVFVPILGIDQQGTRLGSGAGYYDRLFEFRRHRIHWHRPLLVAIAYRCQLLPDIPRERHDVALDALVNEDGVTYFGAKEPRT